MQDSARRRIKQNQIRVFAARYHLFDCVFVRWSHPRMDADKQTSNFDFVRQARRCIHRHARHKKTVQANRQLSRESHLCGRYVQDSGLNFHFFVTDACRPETRSQTQRRGKKRNEESVLDMPSEFSAGLEIFSRHQLTTTRRECAFADHMTLSSSSPYARHINVTDPSAAPDTNLCM